ncbi:PKD domain-containing protein, partial [uncultured Salegentibacter sp.]|uniref:PKD domain-containing protein n=1 Tax=uncultured Salegentibacter sp. TaxID=259320 RepID=UPI002594990A
MKYKLLFINFAFALFSFSLNAQTVDFTTSKPSGDCDNTSVDFYGTASSTTTATSFTFNGGVLPTGWSSSPFAVDASTCPGQNSPDNSAYFWATDTNAQGIRFVQTNAVDVSLGGDIEFYIRYGNDEGSGCEDPDAPNEEVYLQYSTDGGNSWTDIFGDWDTTSTGSFAWYNWYWNSIAIPAAAQTANTIFRWYQPSNSGTTFDNWGLDDVSISAVRPVTVTDWSWDFGDGNTANTQDAANTFDSTPGETNYTVTLTATFSDSSTSTETKQYTVYVDNTPPTATCNTTTYDLYTDNGSCTTQLPDLSGQIVASDDCSTVSITQIPAAGTTLSAGNHTVEFELEDEKGNRTTVCPILVEVIDNVAPVALAKDFTVRLDANGTATIDPADIDNGSNDACGIASLSLDTTEFTCKNVGPNTVTLTVVDNNQNETTATAKVTVEDNVAPVALAKDFTVRLDANGTATIAPADIDNGSNDACAIASLSLDITEFSCEDVGPNTVTLTVVDN